MITPRTATEAPRHALVLVTDVEAFSPRSDVEQMRVREDLYRELRAAFGPQAWRACRCEDRGDGVLVVVPPGVPKAAVFGEALPALDAALACRRRGDPTLRLRVAAHAGDVRFDGHGMGGHAVNHAFRLAQSEPLRAALARARGDSALLVSDALHETLAHDGHPGVDPAAFHPVDVEVKETRARGWLHVPDDDATARQISAAHHTGRERRPGRTEGGVSLNAGRDLSLTDATVANGDVNVTASQRGWWRGAAQRRRGGTR
ncbi:adenylate/guanylate cyclase [Streptantibioticus parmotrematis]|uniref:adenylate/guanylate cyclase n=1 Tax=Streptantibioticus parmotrematis TaxID=2873249 RepID=UPI0027E1AF9A|nr:adenylate/guanylate cyclase [Streptantibioticus parmotrematis]